MNNLINELIQELKSNQEVSESIMVKLLLESINNSVLLGVPSEQILENSLSNLSQIADVAMNENLKEIVAKFMKMAEQPTKRLHDMAKEAGISLKIKALKESALHKDPTFNHTISVIEQKLSIHPEFRVAAFVIESLSGFAYDNQVQSTISEITDYVNENRSKLEIINAIYEMRQTGAVLYRESIAELENCLLEGLHTADTIKMKLHGKPSMPILTRLINTLSMVEAKEQGKFNIGIGNGDSQVNSVIAPFHKISENQAVAFVENSFIMLSEDAAPAEVNPEQLADQPEFVELCEAFASLGFKVNGSEIVAKGRNITIAFSVNEENSLNLKINGKTISDLSTIDLTDLFVMEQLSTRANINKVLSNLDMIVNFGFANRIVNERLGADSIVFTIGEKIYVFEKYGNGRLMLTMNGLDFHAYVMEKFNYDVSELYEIELEERERYVREIEENKTSIEVDLAKLEKTIAQLDEALSDPSLSEEYQTKLSDLRISIEKNVNSLKNQYIELDQAKKKV
jgi:hypothetical protein